MTIAGVDEVSYLLGRFRIDDAAELWWTARRIAKHAARVGDHADLNPANLRVTGDDLFRVAGLKLIEMTFIEQATQNVAHVIRLAMILGKNFVEFFFRSLRFSVFWRLSRGT